MSSVAFEYKKLFRGAKIEDVFDASLEWLTKKGAKIKKADKPSLIESVYGRTEVEWNWDKEILRTVEFEFVATKEYVGVGVYQSPTRKTEKRVLESPFQANISWRDWIDECWDFVQGKVGVAPAAGTPMRIPTAKAAEGAKPPPPPASQAPPPPPKAPPPPPEKKGESSSSP